MPVTIEQWYDEEAIKMDHQWRVTRAKEAFYGKVNQNMQRKPPVPASLSAPLRQTFRNPLQLYWQQQQQQQQSGMLLQDSNMMDVD